jgi:hypothetical protein
MPSLIRRLINNRPHYWNSTGWSRYPYQARIYNEHDARQAHKDMTMDSVMADIRPVKRRPR